MEKTSHLARGKCINWIKLDNLLNGDLQVAKQMPQTITTY